jgi:hypothetical protein
MSGFWWAFGGCLTVVGLVTFALNHRIGDFNENVESAVSRVIGGRASRHPLRRVASIICMCVGIVGLAIALVITLNGG